MFFQEIKGKSVQQEKITNLGMFTQILLNLIFSLFYLLQNTYFFNPDILKRNQLFPGNFQYDRFMKVFCKVIKEKLDTFQALSVEEDTIEL